MHRKEAQAIEVQDAGCMRQHAAKNSATWRCRPGMPGIVRESMNGLSMAMPIAGDMEGRVTRRTRGSTGEARSSRSFMENSLGSIRFYRITASVFNTANSECKNK